MPDLNLKPWAYELRAHQPAVWLGLAGSLGFGMFVLAAGSPLWLLAPAGLAAAIAFAVLARNPRYGTRLTIDGWEFYAPGHRHSIPLRQIDHVAVDPDADSPDTVTVHLIDGMCYKPPDLCLPSLEALKPELARARIRLR